MSVDALEKRITLLEKQNRELMDRYEIYEILTRFGRAVDRLDRELLLSCFHPDAIDDHSIFVGSPDEIVKNTIDGLNQHQTTSQHCLTSHRCDLQGDIAHTETHYYFAGMNPQGPPLILAGGRYFDRLERRNGKWAIAARVHRMEWWGAPADMKPPEKIDPQAEHEPRRDKSDPSYERPLTITRRKPGYRLA
jgi:hypothetical protein